MMLAAGAWAQSDSAKASAADADSEGSTAAAPASGASSSEELQHLKGQLDGLNESYLETKGIADKLNKIKVSGYVQAQWQYADTNGAASVAGGNFPVNAQQRFMVRRGRIKTTYETLTSRYVLQLDVVPGGPVSGGTTVSGGVTLKDAYVTMMEPWLKTASFTMGVFDRPFGFEIGYSSSSRESPERARVFQTLFPGERDMGAKIELTPPAEMGFAQYLNFKGGIFTGLGPLINEIDNEQDIIGRVGFQAPFYDLNLAVDGGFSFYAGKNVAANDTSFSFNDTAFVRATGIRGTAYDRKVMGADAQIYYDLPVIGGLSLRGEYLWGEIPGTSGASGPYSTSTAPVYNRKVAGWYAIWVQNLGTKVQSVVKYDFYDPNTDLEGSDVRALVAPQSGRIAPSSADLAYTTLGLGLVYHWDENLKFTGYYDIVTNEEAGATAAGGNAAFRDDRSDNVFTFRAQAKF